MLGCVLVLLKSSGVGSTQSANAVDICAHIHDHLGPTTGVGINLLVRHLLSRPLLRPSLPSKNVKPGTVGHLCQLRLWKDEFHNMV